MDRIIKYNNKLTTWDNKYLKRNPDPYIEPWPTDGLIGRWRLSSNLNDSVNALNFSVTYGTEAYDAGKDGNALTWTDGAVFEVDNATTLGAVFNGTHAFSMLFWYKMISVVDSIIIIMSTDGTATWSGQTGSASVRAHSNSLNATEYGRKPGKEKYNDLTPDVNLWNHWMLIYDENYTKLYVNNTLIGTCAADTTSEVDVRYLRINCKLTGLGGGCVNGAMQNLYLYDKALSESDRGILYNSGTPL